MKTSGGVELNLNESNYFAIYNNFKFVFSSNSYKQKFLRLVDSYVDIETLKLYNKYKIRSNFKLFLSFSLYRKIETRGFRVIDLTSSKEYNSFAEFHDFIISI